MGSAEAVGGELTARARILHAAVRRFAVDGVAAPLRTIAADAGVSAALIIHHFGSRDGLREACDAHVLTVARENKTPVLGGGSGAGAMLTQLAQIEGYAPVVGYVLRRLQAGGLLATQLVDGFVSDAVGYLRQGEAAGVVRPSRNPEARARVLTEQALGALLLQLPAQQEHLDLEELPGWLRAYSERIVGPLLEVYTEPLLTDRSLLDSYVESRTGQAPER
ncbi:TetR family transcriptional regulator [Georgenia satyanarayanai]|uniref:TetR/AcrR family transcriptional regulator n=1 Tax=Georgenia satyanarayanai TaxID=860221 RepID=UPI00203E62DC|nr:TetR family transcriptional regulator [Georgenia satyanarayanai]MCM3660898.1 TetR family transcriptional regulator [Georgenia satyanarayanai]